MPTCLYRLSIYHLNSLDGYYDHYLQKELNRCWFLDSTSFETSIQALANTTSLVMLQRFDFFREKLVGGGEGFFRWLVRFFLELYVGMGFISLHRNVGVNGRLGSNFLFLAQILMNFAKIKNHCKIDVSAFAKVRNQCRLDVSAFAGTLCDIVFLIDIEFMVMET